MGTNSEPGNVLRICENPAPKPPHAQPRTALPTAPVRRLSLRAGQQGARGRAPLQSPELGPGGELVPGVKFVRLPRPRPSRCFLTQSLTSTLQEVARLWLPELPGWRGALVPCLTPLGRHVGRTRWYLRSWLRLLLMQITTCFILSINPLPNNNKACQGFGLVPYYTT